LPQSPDDTGDDLAMEVIADQIRGQAIAAIDLVASSGGRVNQRTVGQASAGDPGLDVADQDRRTPDDVQIGLELIGRREVAGVNRKLKISGHAAGAALKPDLALVVLRHTPLSAVRPGWLLDETGRSPAQPKRVD